MRSASVQTRREFLQHAALVAGALASAPAIGVLAGDGAAAAAGTSDIVSVAIHPAVGVARVGNSADSFYFGPELPGALAHPRDGFKDATGAVARQAVRFRLYGYDRRGRVVRELTEKDARITWSVSVANAKASWYDYDVAMDLPTARPVSRRNAAITGDARASLAIAPGSRTIDGRARAPVALDGGSFLGAPVTLGELMVDGRGRLVVVPGSGAGYSPTSAPLTTFSDNNGWADDICDGPVFATVDLDGRSLQATPAWVVVTPPNYGPALASGLVTAYDSARTAWDTPDDVGAVRFATDILPVLTRLVDMQWVNSGFLRSNGWHTDGNYLDPATVERLASRSRRHATARRAIFEQLRDPTYATYEPDAVPQIYGDGVELTPQSPYQWLAVTSIQFRAFQRWAAGDFVDDRDSAPTTDDVDDLPVRQRPAALDRANLDQCLGGAYHPGIEMPWTLRVPSMWASPGRLQVRSTVLGLVDYGDLLTPTMTLAADGPLAGSGPGDLTRWLGTPWHADAASCRSGYDPAVSPVLPTFWPARIPNHVLRESDYRIVVDRDRPLAERKAAFRARYDWERFVSAPNRQSTLHNMVAGWWKLGMVQERRGPGDDEFPRVLKVESDVGFDAEPAVAYGPDYRPQDPAEFEGTRRQ